MEQGEGSSYGPLPTLHEYPDPDYAAYVTKYPWVGEEDGYVPPELQDQAGGARNGGPLAIDRFDRPTDRNRAVGDYGAPLTGPDRETLFDPDYQTSDGGVSEDDIISDGDSANSIETLQGFNYMVESPSPLEAGQRLGHGTSALKVRGVGRRGRRRGGLGRGGKGIKRGPRKAIEPTTEFKALHSQATMAFIDQDYEEAEQITLQAILINPEMYPAHNLLSEIHAARGDKDKAISAAWAGAHTRPRDPEMWSRIGRMILERDGDNKASTLRDAIYCYSRIISLDKYNIEARYQRATLNHELGRKGKAAIEYEQLIKQLPHDTTVLRHLAEIYIELEEPERALEHYQSSISHFQIIEPDEVASFTWSDVNIVTELYGFQHLYEEGIVQLKSLSRWLLGRGKDTFWEAFDKDDREWDFDDQPRRTEVPDFIQGKYDAISYGDGLPLELHVKLGVFRLKAENEDLEEAIASTPSTLVNHFEWLDPEDNQAGAKLYDYTDLFREAANALRGLDYHHEALRYYEPLQQVSDYVDASYFSEMASCYRAVSLRAEAEECYKMIIEHDKGNLFARTQLAGVRQISGMSLQGPSEDSPMGSVKQHKASRLRGDKDSKRSKKASAPQSRSTTMLAPRPMHQPAKQLVVEKVQVQEEEIHSLFLHRQSLTEGTRSGNQDCKAEWMTTTKILLQEFKDNKVFYPFDKHHKFFGYSKEARVLASRPKHELDALIESTKSIFETADGDHIIVPDTYCGIHFNAWLDMFLEYGLTIAHSGNIKTAYEIIASAFHANVFYHSAESLFLIHVCWFSCALIGNDDETLCNIARWFMKEYQFVTNGYLLFSALNRLCDSENSWYNCGPSQKYILRQLKAVDFSLLGETRRKSLFQERASYSTKDSDGKQIRADDMDVALLMLYGHILYAGRSYSYAVNYFLRALALDPSNPMIKLSLALGYLHFALKRQADNRHHILMQGLAFLLEYYDDRVHSSSFSEKQEAEYNVAHAYHLLGLTHLGIPYYERCLELSTSVQTESLDCRVEDFSHEAALTLQGFWAASGNIEEAREVTEKWLVI